MSAHLARVLSASETTFLFCVSILFLGSKDLPKKQSLDGIQSNYAQKAIRSQFKLSSIIGTKLVNVGAKYLVILTATETPDAKDIASKKLFTDTGWTYCWLQYLDPEHYFPFFVPDGTVYWYSCIKCTSTYTMHIRTYNDPSSDMEIKATPSQNPKSTKEYYSSEYNHFTCTYDCTNRPCIQSTRYYGTDTGRCMGPILDKAMCEKDYKKASWRERQSNGFDRWCSAQEVYHGRCGSYKQSCTVQRHWKYTHDTSQMTWWLLAVSKSDQQQPSDHRPQRSFKLLFKVTKESHPVLKFA